MTKFETEIERYREIGINISVENDVAQIKGINGDLVWEEVLKAEMSEGDWGLLIFNGFTVETRNIFTTGFNFAPVIHPHSLQPTWVIPSIPFKIYGRVHYEMDLTFRYSFQIKDGDIPWERFGEWTEWPSKEDLLKFQEEFLGSYRLASRFFAFLKINELEPEVRTNSFLLGRVNIVPEGHSLCFSVKAANSNEFAEASKVFSLIEGYLRAQATEITAPVSVRADIESSLDLV
jgi:hypothetical protein